MRKYVLFSSYRVFALYAYYGCSVTKTMSLVISASYETIIDLTVRIESRTFTHVNMKKSQMCCE